MDNEEIKNIVTTLLINNKEITESILQLEETNIEHEKNIIQLENIINQHVVDNYNLKKNIKKINITMLEKIIENNVLTEKCKTIIIYNNILIIINFILSIILSVFLYGL